MAADTHPDHAATSQIMTDLAVDLVARGEEVDVVAGSGSYLGGTRLAKFEAYRGVRILPRWISYTIGRVGTWLAWRLMPETRAAMVDNLRALDYPADKLEVLIGSDGSTDCTNDLVRKCADARVTLHAFEQRSGKPSVSR